MHRVFDGSAWVGDKWFQNLTRDERYLFMYLFTNDHTNACGAYEITVKTIANEADFTRDEVTALLTKLKDKVTWFPDLDIVFIHNFYKNQRGNGGGVSKFDRGAAVAAAKLPEKVRNAVYEKYPLLATHFEKPDQNAPENTDNPSIPMDSLSIANDSLSISVDSPCSDQVRSGQIRSGQNRVLGSPSTKANQSPPRLTDDDDQGSAEGGRKPADSPQQVVVVAKLRGVGCSERDVADVLSLGISSEEILQQVEWLPGRQAKNPSVMLLKAIRERWGPPRPPEPPGNGSALGRTAKQIEQHLRGVLPQGGTP